MTVPTFEFAWQGAITANDPIYNDAGYYPGDGGLRMLALGGNRFVFAELFELDSGLPHPNNYDSRDRLRLCEVGSDGVVTILDTLDLSVDWNWFEFDPAMHLFQGGFVVLASHDNTVTSWAYVTVSGDTLVEESYGTLALDSWSNGAKSSVVMPGGEHILLLESEQDILYKWNGTGLTVVANQPHLNVPYDNYQRHAVLLPSGKVVEYSWDSNSGTAPYQTHLWRRTVSISGDTIIEDEAGHNTGYEYPYKAAVPQGGNLVVDGASIMWPVVGYFNNSNYQPHIDVTNGVDDPVSFVLPGTTERWVETYGVCLIEPGIVAYTWLDWDSSAPEDIHTEVYEVTGSGITQLFEHVASPVEAGSQYAGPNVIRTEDFLVYITAHTDFGSSPDWIEDYWLGAVTYKIEEPLPPATYVAGQLVAGPRSQAVDWSEG